MTFYKYEKTGDVAEYFAVGDTITQFTDVIVNTYFDGVRVMIIDGANSPTIERASFIPFQDEIEISESEFFTAYIQAYSSIVEILKGTATYKAMHFIDETTKTIREQVITSYLNQLLGINGQTGTAP